MDSRVAAELIPPVYEDFDPSSEMVHEKEFDTILLNLPGFRKDHLKVQLTTSKILRISGSRLVEGNKWRRFQKEFPVTPGRDPQRISAKFEGGILHVKVPMLIPTPGKKLEENKKSPVTIRPEKPLDHKGSDKEQPTDDKSSVIAKEEPKEEKKAEKSPEQDNQEEQKKANKKSSEEKIRVLNDTKKQNTTEKLDDDMAKNQPDQEVKTRGLVEESKEMKRAGEDGDDESPETMDHESEDKTQDENLQNDASKVLKKHRSMFNIVLVAMLAIAVGVYVSDLFKFLRRIKY